MADVMAADVASPAGVAARLVVADPACDPVVWTGFSPIGAVAQAASALLAINKASRSQCEAGEWGGRVWGGFI